MTGQEIHRIAAGPRAAGWTDFERVLLRMVDELRYDAMVGDSTWRALRSEYSDRQMMEAVFTVSQYQLVSMALNSFGVQLDPGLQHRLPRDLPLPKLARAATGARLTTPRILPLASENWTPEQRALITSQIRADGKILNLYATMLQHPGLYATRASFESYLQNETSLLPRTRILLGMRTAYLFGAEYDWAHYVERAREAGMTDEQIARIATGPNSTGWDEESRALLWAADELRREAFITNRTWSILAKRYSARQLIEIVFTVGGCAMSGLAGNSFGIQLESGYPSFPLQG
jgi:4-carboxymuconolactone decarboxylase